MKILVIEDEVMLANSLKTFLADKGFEVDCVFNGTDGAAYAETGIYDLVILDLVLSELDGCTVAKNIRKNQCGVPILMLSANTDVSDEIAGLNAGADYFLSLPFEPEKLLACVNALLRRQGKQVNVLTVGNTSLNLENSVLSCEGKQIRLSAKEFDVMRFLMASYGKIISKEILLCRVWGYDSNAVENNVEVYVTLLRKKLRSIGSDVCIEAVRSLGYVIKG